MLIKQNLPVVSLPALRLSKGSNPLPLPEFKSVEKEIKIKWLK